MAMFVRVLSKSLIACTTQPAKVDNLSGYPYFIPVVTYLMSVMKIKPVGTCKMMQYDQFFLAGMLYSKLLSVWKACY